MILERFRPSLLSILCIRPTYETDRSHLYWHLLSPYYARRNSKNCEWSIALSGLGCKRQLHKMKYMTNRMHDKEDSNCSPCWGGGSHKGQSYLAQAAPFPHSLFWFITLTLAEQPLPPLGGIPCHSAAVLHPWARGLIYMGSQASDFHGVCREVALMSTLRSEQGLTHEKMEVLPPGT